MKTIKYKLCCFLFVPLFLVFVNYIYSAYCTNKWCSFFLGAKNLDELEADHPEVHVFYDRSQSPKKWGQVVIPSLVPIPFFPVAGTVFKEEDGPIYAYYGGRLDARSAHALINFALGSVEENECNTFSDATDREMNDRGFFKAPRQWSSISTVKE